MAKKLASDSVLFAVSVMLMGLGLVIVWSASSALAREAHGNAYHFLVRQIVWAVLGLVGMAAACASTTGSCASPRSSTPWWWGRRCS